MHSLKTIWQNRKKLEKPSRVIREKALREAHVTQGHQETPSPLKPPIEVGCCDANNHHSSAFMKQESSVNEFLA